MNLARGYLKRESGSEVAVIRLRDVLAMQPDQRAQPNRQQIVAAVERQLERIVQDHGAPRILLTWGVNSENPDDWRPIATFLEYPVIGHDHESGSKEHALRDSIASLANYLIGCAKHNAEERLDNQTQEDDEWEHLWVMAVPLDQEELARALGEWAPCAKFLDVRDSGSMHIAPSVAQQWVDEFLESGLEGPPRETWDDDSDSDDG